MAVTLFPNFLAASSGFFFAFQNSTLPGRLILFSLFLASVFSWTVMVTKFRMLRHAQRRRDQFLSLFRTDRQPLRIYTDRIRFDGAPLFAVYKAGCQELTFQLLGSAEVDETFRGRLDAAPRISPAQMRVVTSAMERAVGETALRLESQMIILATAVSGAPFPDRAEQAEERRPADGGGEDNHLPLQPQRGLADGALDRKSVV